MSVVKQGGEGWVLKGVMDDTAQCLSTVNHVTPLQRYQEVEGDGDSP